MGRQGRLTLGMAALYYPEGGGDFNALLLQEICSLC